MKKGKLLLGKITIKSFRTNLSAKTAETIRGGEENSNCRTQCFIGCQSAAESGCGSCGGGTGGGGTSPVQCGTYEIISCYEPCN